jgi:hypothetical protein
MPTHRKRRAQSVSSQRLSPRRSPGIAPRSEAPFWQGRRAEHVVAERTAVARAEKEQKAAERAAKRGAKGSRTPRSRERTPSQQLRRLERALGRRKTLVARQRVQAQIDQLKRELGLE